MRTTLTVDDDLMRELRDEAHRRGLALKRLVNLALRAGIRDLDPERRKKRYHCPEYSLGELLPPAANPDKALALAEKMMADEIARKLELRK